MAMRYDGSSSRPKSSAHLASEFEQRGPLFLGPRTRDEPVQEPERGLPRGERPDTPRTPFGQETVQVLRSKAVRLLPNRLGRGFRQFGQRKRRLLGLARFTRQLGEKLGCGLADVDGAGVVPTVGHGSEESEGFHRTICRVP